MPRHAHGRSRPRAARSRVSTGSRRPSRAARAGARSPGGERSPARGRRQQLGERGQPRRGHRYKVAPGAALPAGAPRHDGTHTHAHTRTRAARGPCTAQGAAGAPRPRPGGGRHSQTKRNGDPYGVAVQVHVNPRHHCDRGRVCTGEPTGLVRALRLGTPSRRRPGPSGAAPGPAERAEWGPCGHKASVGTGRRPPSGPGAAAGHLAPGRPGFPRGGGYLQGLCTNRAGHRPRAVLCSPKSPGQMPARNPVGTWAGRWGPRDVGAQGEPAPRDKGVQTQDGKQ